MHTTFTIYVDGTGCALYVHCVHVAFCKVEGVRAPYHTTIIVTLYTPPQRYSISVKEVK